MSESSSQPTPQRLMQFAFGFVPPLMIEAAIQHRIFDTLDSGPQTLEQLAAETGTSQRGLRALLNGLVALEFLSKDSEQRYHLTPESATFLVSIKPSFHGGIFRHTSTQLMPKFLQLNEIVKTGQPATAVNQHEAGTAFFEQFVEDIFPMSYAGVQVLGHDLKLAESSAPVRVLDIAAGSGVWGIGLAQQSPNVQVTALDWEGVLPVTKRMVERFGLNDQFNYIEGDLRTTDYGTGYNIATLGHILHSEGEQHSRSLIKKVYDALAPGGTIAIGEMLANEERTGPPHAMLFAINMLVNTDEGDTFSFEEIGEWLREVGFTDVRLLEAPAPSPLVIATKPA